MRKEHLVARLKAARLIYLAVIAVGLFSFYVAMPKSPDLDAPVSLFGWSIAYADVVRYDGLVLLGLSAMFLVHVRAVDRLSACASTEEVEDAIESVPWVLTSCRGKLEHFVAGIGSTVPTIVLFLATAQMVHDGDGAFSMLASLTIPLLVLSLVCYFWALGPIWRIRLDHTERSVKQAEARECASVEPAEPAAAESEVPPTD